MRAMGKREIALTLALGAVFTLSLIASAQSKSSGKTSPGIRSGATATVEPLRVINGQMRGRIIAGQFAAKGRSQDFSLTLSKAEIVNGKLQLAGDFRLGRSPRSSQQLTATIAGTMANADNPWPGPSDEAPKPKPKAKASEQQQGREAKNPEAAGQIGQLAQSTQDTARKTPPAPGERNEQTQSLYAQAETQSGCGLLFLRLELPPQLRAAMGAGANPVQLGVVLAPFDNRMGEGINRRICAILRASDGKADNSRMAASVEEFNRFLASSQ